MPRARSAILPAAGVAVLAAIFGMLSWAAVSTKSATADEPLHVVGGWMATHYHDFRCNPEDPPLWKYWACIPCTTEQFPFDEAKLAHSPVWKQMPHNMFMQWIFSEMTIYDPAIPDPEAALARQRAMMVALGVVLALLIADWSWRIGGAAAALAATFVYCLDPNFLGHAGLVKNDVPLSLSLAFMAWSVWKLGRRATWLNALIAALACGAVLTVKFSGVLVGPIAAAMLVTRAMFPQPWPVLGRTLATRGSRLLAAAGLLAAMAVISWVVIWACYDFRYNPSPDPTVRLPIRLQIDSDGARIGVIRFEADMWADAYHADARNYSLSLLDKTVIWADDHHLFPQAYLVGFLYTYASTISRQTFLLGHYSNVGWWYYFPLAMLFKTPTATLIAFIAAVAMGVYLLRLRAAADWTRRWTIACLAIPPAIYLAVAMHGHLNLGLRHVLPIYPFAFIALGWLFAAALARWKKITLALAAVLAVGLFVENLYAFPDYIAFFNAPSASYGKINLLSDSNLDWGQDLKALEAWKTQHRPARLYICYFGAADTGSYVSSPFIDIRHGVFPSSPIIVPTEPGIIAISATTLQGTYLKPKDRQFVAELRQRKPIVILDDTIYLFQWEGNRGQ
jgi:4-amino-4-deoxy-L-arabinose transferase-like glycosyltransferase